MRKVMIGTPCHSGSVHCRYANSFIETVRMGARLGIEVHQIFIPGNAMVHSARNDIVQRFMASDFDDLVFIDADVSWFPEDFFRLLNHQVDVIGATYPLKQSALVFVMKSKDGRVPELREDGLMVVQSLGMGFFRLSRRAVEALWECSMPYSHVGDSREFRSVFEFAIIDGIETGEDVAMCMKCPEVFLDPSIILEHHGDRSHSGNPLEWLALVKVEQDRLDTLKETEVISEN